MPCVPLQTARYNTSVLHCSPLVLWQMHPTAAGRTYAAYGGVYVTSSIIWLWLIEGARPTVSDLVGSAVALIGMSIIMFGQR